MPHPNRVFPVLSARDKLLPFYLLGIGLHHEQEHIRRDTGIQDYQWIQCRSGEGKLKLSGTEHVVKQGMGMLLFPASSMNTMLYRGAGKLTGSSSTAVDQRGCLKPSAL